MKFTVDQKQTQIKQIKPVPYQPAFFSQIKWEVEDSISFRLKKLIFEALREVQPQAVKDLEISDIILEHPNSENYGDYSTNLAMKLSGKLNLPAGEAGMKPVELAEKIKDQLDKRIIKHQSRSSKTDSKTSSDGIEGQNSILEKVEVAPPGFLNLWLHTPSLITELIEVLNNIESVSTVHILKGKKISVEYTDPNPFKEFHLGHMYSNFIGEGISRMFEACGAGVWRADYYGDVGMHVAKSVWGMMKKMEDERKSLSELDKLTIPQRQNFLGQGYALGVKKYEEDPKSQQEIKDLNLLLYVAGQEILKITKKWKPLINYRQYVTGSLESLPELIKVYEAGLRWSLEYFETIYKRLGTKFDGYYPESWVGEYGIKLVEEGLKQGIMEKSDGSVIFRGEKYGLHTRVFVNKLGLPTYEAKELGLAPAKYEEFKYDLSVIVTGNEIKEYFYVLLTVLRQIAPELGEKTLNVSHGMVKLPEGKMSSRTGNVITFAHLLGEAKEYALKIMKNADLPKEEMQKVAEVVGLGAIRYALLKSNIGLDVTFDFDKSVSFEGDSGPYLLYTYARCRSVLRKAEDLGFKNYDLRISENILESSIVNLNSEERTLLRTLYRFPEVIIEATRTLSPNLICSFLFDLAQKYNLFYNKHSILGKVVSRQSLVVSKNDNDQGDQSPATNDQQLTTNFRLFLTHATSSIIKKGLHLLGIQTVERM